MEAAIVPAYIAGSDTAESVGVDVIESARGAHDARLQCIGEQLTSLENVIGNVVCLMVVGLPRSLVTK